MTWASIFKVKKSGTHTSLKVTAPITTILSNVHPPQPKKGAQNPEHVQINLPKSIAKLVKGDNNE
jgi:hypothetical protein